MSKKPAFAVLCGLVLLCVVYATAALRTLGFSELPNGRGGTNVEAVAYTPEMGFDKKRSLKAFQETNFRCFAPTAPDAIALKTAPLVELRLPFTQTST